MPRTDRLTTFQDRLDEAIAAVRASTVKEAVILHHEEADGPTSAALTKLALERIGFHPRLICLDKLYPEVVRDIESGRPQVVAYVDFGSGHIDWLSQANTASNIILVLDHHDTSATKD